MYGHFPMINAIELGRIMMRYAPNLDDDSEFNQWCKLAPKLISIGNIKELNNFSPVEFAVIKRAIMLLTAQGESVE